MQGGSNAKRSTTLQAFSLKGLQLRPKALKAVMKGLAAAEDYDKQVKLFAEACKQHLRRATTRTTFVEENMVNELLNTFQLQQQAATDPDDPMDVDGSAAAAAGSSGNKQGNNQGSNEPSSRVLAKVQAGTSASSSSSAVPPPMFAPPPGAAAAQLGLMNNKGVQDMEIENDALNASTMANKAGLNTTMESIPNARQELLEQERNKFAHLGDGIAVYNVFKDTPVMEYNTSTHTFQVSTSFKPTLFPDADRRPRMMQERQHVCESQLYHRNKAAVELKRKAKALNLKLPKGKDLLKEVPQMQYYPSSHEFTNKQQICRGQTNLYEILIPVIPRASHHSRRIESDDPKDIRDPIPPGTTVAICEWYTSAHDKPEWYLKLQKLPNSKQEGWIPYRASIAGVEQDTVKPRGEPDKCMITCVESLVGNYGHKITFGLLVEAPNAGSSSSSSGMHGRRYALQEGRKRIELNLKHFAQADELIIHGGFYVVEGIVDNEHGILHVCKMWNPPITETKTPIQPGSKKRKRIPDAINHFGGNITLEDLKYLTKIEEMEDAEKQLDCNRHLVDARLRYEREYYVLMADVNFDDPNTFEMLAVVFDRFEDSEHQPHYILMGKFRAPDHYFDPRMENTVHTWKDKLLHLSTLLASHEHTRKKRIIIVPDSSDHCGHPDFFPLPPMETYGVQFRENVIFASNPCRIRHYGKQIVICRNDVWKELREAECVPFRDQGDPTRRFDAIAHYLLAQAHLFPVLPVAHRNTLIGFDHGLRMYPPPDLLLLSSGMWRTHISKPQADTEVLFLGAFTQRSQWGFYTYNPAPDVLVDGAETLTYCSAAEV
ncbi:unnamed protein product [Amoebophrya sp. A120]|nr:unnamed protein product [Amoebophrya sp. A120]|eukprot:GSA120T00005335001.1